MKKIVFSIIVLLSLSNACTDGFEDFNTNKNAPAKANADLLLPTIIFDIANITVNQSYVFNDIVSQYAGNYEYNDLDLFRWYADDRFWTPMYHILEDIKDLKASGEELKNENYKAVALVLESYIYSVITDSYGPAPMSEANKTVEGYVMPKYDSQEQIYTAIFAKLEEANSLFKTEKGIKGDILYSEDVMKWRKFANSLHIRLLMHISNVENVKERISKIINNPTTFPVFSSNDDNAIYEYSGSYPNISQVAAAGGGRAYDYFRPIPTTHFIKTLRKNNDPRLLLWVSPKEGTENRTLGVTPGINIGDIGRPAAYSRRSVTFFNSATQIKSILMTYSELNFLLAEAHEKDILTTGDNAKAYYEIAVKSSFEQWGVAMPVDFVSTTVPYNSNNENLYEQKWLALYHTGIEAWLDWKRNRKPSFLKAGVATVNNGKIPVRLKYPSLEASVNTENYQKASISIGGDNINSSAWWW